MQTRPQHARKNDMITHAKTHNTHAKKINTHAKIPRHTRTNDLHRNIKALITHIKSHNTHAKETSTWTQKISPQAQKKGPSNVSARTQKQISTHVKESRCF